MKTVLFCDFDGTVARCDVGYAMFHHFSGGKNDELIPDWKAGRLSSRECLLKEAAMMNASAEEIAEFVATMEIDSGFSPLVKKCRNSGLPLVVVSDGLDLYINQIFERYGLTDLPIMSNHGRVEDRKLIIEFPHSSRSCMRCGNCKAERIREFRADYDGPIRVVFIGDGYSDACATTEADLIFAKKDLERFCHEKKVDYLSYSTFLDVKRELNRLGLFADPTKGT